MFRPPRFYSRQLRFTEATIAPTCRKCLGQGCALCRTAQLVSEVRHLRWLWCVLVSWGPNWHRQKAKDTPHYLKAFRLHHLTHLILTLKFVQHQPSYSFWSRSWMFTSCYCLSPSSFEDQWENPFLKKIPPRTFHQELPYPLVWKPPR